MTRRESEQGIAMLIPSAVSGKIHSAKDESLFVACASYEDRSLATIQNLSDDYRVAHATVFLSKEYEKKGKTPEHFKLIKERIQAACNDEPNVIRFGIAHTIQSMFEFQCLCQRWESSAQIQSITVDVSTFPREEMLLLLRVVDNLPNHPAIRLFYAEPQKYGTEEKEGWLTRGVKSVHSVPGLGGIQEPGKRKLLVIFLGHESERAAITWKRHQPSETIVIVPDPSYRSDLNGITEATHQLSFIRFWNASQSCRVPARGIMETEQAVLDIWKKYHDSYYLVVAPLGTKLQTLGIYRAARIKPDIQITYAAPVIYNFESYSKGIGPIWEILWNAP